MIDSLRTQYTTTGMDCVCCLVMDTRRRPKLAQPRRRLGFGTAPVKMELGLLAAQGWGGGWVPGLPPHFSVSSLSRGEGGGPLTRIDPVTPTLSSTGLSSQQTWHSLTTKRTRCYGLCSFSAHWVTTAQALPPPKIGWPHLIRRTSQAQENFPSFNFVLQLTFASAIIPFMDLHLQLQAMVES